MLDTEILHMLRIWRCLQFSDMCHELLLENAWFAQPNSSLHRLKFGSQPAHHNLRLRYRLSKSFTFGSSVQCLAEQQSPESQCGIVLSDCRQVANHQIVGGRHW